MSIKPGKIKILLHGEPYHTKVFCEQLENYKKGVFEPKYYENLSHDVSYDSFDLFHLISPPLPEIKRLRKFNKPVIYHWIGTDVYRFLNDSFIKKISKKHLLKSSGVINLVVSENLKDELNSIGITSAILPLVKLKFINEIPPLPEKFTVLAYVPEQSWDYYSGDIIIQLAEKFPDIDFHIVASGERDLNLKNVFPHGFIEDLKLFYKNCSALVRLTVHDGLPKMVLEALSYGRHVLWSGVLPNCFKTTTLEECINVLGRLKENPEVNSAGKEYIEKNFNPAAIAEDYYNLCKKILAG